MDIRRYQDYFHDGSVIRFEYTTKNIVAVLESCEILPEWNLDIELSSRHTITGKLHICGVKSLTVNGRQSERIPEHHPFIGSIMDLEVHNGTDVELLISWIGGIHDDSISQLIKAEAERTYWENIPNL